MQHFKKLIITFLWLLRYHMMANDVTIVYVRDFLGGKMAPRVVQLCFAFVRSIPVVFITAVIGWSYYAYVVQMCICTYNTCRVFCDVLLAMHPFRTQPFQETILALSV